MLELANKSLSSSSLIGRFHADSSRNTAAEDLTPNGNDGTLNGTILTVGRWSFDGVNDFNDHGNSTLFNFERTDSFSFEFVFESSVGGNNMLLSRVSGSANSEGYWIRLLSGKLNIRINSDTSPSNYISVSTTANLDDGVKHHAILTYDGSSAASGVTIYVDGVVQAVSINQDTLTTSIAGASSVLRIGRYVTSAFFWNGFIDWVSVHFAELTATEALENYKAQKVGL